MDGELKVYRDGISFMCANKQDTLIPKLILAVVKDLSVGLQIYFEFRGGVQQF